MNVIKKGKGKNGEKLQSVRVVYRMIKIEITALSQIFNLNELVKMGVMKW